MPRVISDELYEDLISNITQQRLLGIMGKLEELRRSSQKLHYGPTRSYKTDVQSTLIIREYLTVEEIKDETKTNNN